MIKILVGLMLTVPFVEVWAQKEEDIVLAKQLHNEFEEANVASLSYTSTYEFKRENGKTLVSQNEVNHYIALKSNISHTKSIYYDEKSEIGWFKIETERGKRVDFDKYCGHQEVEDIFYSDAQFCAYNFKMPNPGKQVVFKANKNFYDLKYLTKVFFHDAVPSKKREVTIKVPNWVEVELMEINFDRFKISKSVKNEGKHTTYHYSIKNLGAFDNEPNTMGTLYDYPHILVLSKAYSINQERTTLLSSSEDLYKWYHSMTNKVKNDDSAFQPTVFELVKDLNDREDKIKAIYYWVQDNIKYIAFEDGIAAFQPEDAQSVFKNRYGDCKGMANLTKEMLKVAGFDARLTWIGTKKIPYSHEIPSLAVDNHMICTVLENDKKLILDATEKFIALGKHAERIQGQEIMIEDGNKFILDKVPVGTNDENLIERSEEITINGEKLQGSGLLQVNGEAKKGVLYISNNVQQSNKKKLFEYMAVSESTNTDEIKIIKTDGLDRDNTLSVEYDYILDNKVTAFDNDLYIDIDFRKEYKNMTMEESRLGDFYFGNKVLKRTEKKLKLPSGYAVSHLPASFEEKHPTFSFFIKFESKNGYVTYTKELSVADGIVKKQDFGSWNDAIKKLKASYDDQVVLTKQ